MMVRRTAADSTDSLFISVLEAVEGESMLEEIRQIDTNGDDKEQICIQEGRVTYKIYDDINGKKVWQE